MGRHARLPAANVGVGVGEVNTHGDVKPGTGTHLLYTDTEKMSGRMTIKI